MTVGLASCKRLHCKTACQCGPLLTYKRHSPGTSDNTRPRTWTCAFVMCSCRYLLTIESAKKPLYEACSNHCLFRCRNPMSSKSCLAMRSLRTFRCTRCLRQINTHCESGQHVRQESVVGLATFWWHCHVDACSSCRAPLHAAFEVPLGQRAALLRDAAVLLQACHVILHHLRSALLSR